MSKQNAMGTSPSSLDKRDVLEVNLENKGIRLPYRAIRTQIKFLQGKVLTVIDASISESQQNKAVKDLIKAVFGEQLEWLFELCGKPFDELGESQGTFST